MKNVKSLIIVIVALVGFSSCTVTEEISLKKNFSGTYTMKVDMKEMVTALEGFGGDSLLQGMEEGLTKMEESANEMNSMDGVSNSEPIVDRANHIYGMKFDFANIDVLNKAKSKDGDALSSLTGKTGSEEEHVFFTKKGKKLIYKFPEIKSEEDLGMGAQMLGSSKYKIVFISDSKIKKVSNKTYTTSVDKQKTEKESSLMEVLDGNSDFSVTLKF